MSWDILSFYFSNLTLYEVGIWYLTVGFLTAIKGMFDDLSFDEWACWVIVGLITLGWPFTFGLLFDKEGRSEWTIPAIVIGIACCMLSFTYSELTMSPEQKVARAEKIYFLYKTPEYLIKYEEALFKKEKQEIEDAHQQEILKAQQQLKLAEIRSKRSSLRNNESSSQRHSAEITQLKNKIQAITAKGADYSKLSQATISNSKSEPVDEQNKLILSAIWLGACFFLQRLFEKLFKDKGYALLTVCATGFLLAFFTANYFLLGGSVTGGIMGSVGDRA